LENVLDHIVIERPAPCKEKPQNLCADAGYAGQPAEDAICSRGYAPQIRSRGDEKKEIERREGFKARRWVVEVCHSWLNRFRKLLVRFEKKHISYMNLLYFACAYVVWHRIKVI
jgi:transposase